MNTIRMMVRIKQYLITALFLLIVLIPAVILSYFAVRSVNQEEMVQRQRLEDSLLLELDQTNTIIRFNLDLIRQELHETIPDFNISEPHTALKNWKTTSPLTGTPYLLNTDGSISFPDISSKNNDEANLFYWRYLNLFSNKESIPVYQNIASEYQEEILDQETETATFDAAEEKYASKESTDAFGANETAKAERNASGADADELKEQDFRSVMKEAVQIPSALKIFEADKAVQERVYSQAEEEGQQYLTRNLLPQLIPAARDEKSKTVIRSVYIESTKYFEDIIKNNDYGIIPRMFDSSFILLYWEKQGDIIAGCEINMATVYERLKDAVQIPENSFRFINIIDHGGSPLIPFEGSEKEKWRQPFVAKEISELLPYWETAILLRSPEEFQKHIESSRYYLMFIVTFLCALILIGITAVFRYSSSRLREVQQRVGFVTNVSHELKTPLTSIRMYSEMMAEGFQKNPEKMQKYSAYIASESQRLTRLINNVLDFAKLEKGTKVLNLKKADICSVISDIIPSVREELFKKGFTVIYSPEERALSVMCDREEIIQVLINLISNAEKYSNDEKYVEIKTELNNCSAVVKVIDRGNGIPKKYRKKIFKEFYRIDTSITSPSRGTGLGLSIARKIMRQHGGDLIFTPFNNDDSGKGSIFSLIFPSCEIKDK
jgi:signal transduction histidine kinase